MSQMLELTGLDGANPLGFLAALGALRVAAQVYPGSQMCWIARGKWLPVLKAPGEVSPADAVRELHSHLHRTADPIAAEEAAQKQEEYQERVKEVKLAEKHIKERKLRGAEREEAVRAEVEPLRRKAEAARAEWLRALERAVPVPYLSLGRTLAVTPEEYRHQFAERVSHRLHALIGEGAPPANPCVRENADFAAAFGSEACEQPSGRIIPTEFQLITGSGHQFFLGTLRALMEEVTPEKIARALFGPWAYCDARLSFRWDPAEDRRYAYGWANPSDDCVWTEHGANLLAAMALPLFPAVPIRGRLVTTGFDSEREPATFTWPIWEGLLGPDLVRSLLGLAALQQPVPNRARLRRLGIVEVFRTSKIEVGRPPLSKWNLTPPIAV
jgi:hypothetical protein